MKGSLAPYEFDSALPQPLFAPTSRAIELLPDCTWCARSNWKESAFGWIQSAAIGIAAVMYT